MPPDDRFRPDQDKVAAPIGAEASDQNPEQPVVAPEGWPALRAQGDLELLAQEEILHDQVVSPSEGGAEGTGSETQQFNHR